MVVVEIKQFIREPIERESHIVKTIRQLFENII